MARRAQLSRSVTSDEELAIAARRGDTKAFSTLYNRHADYIHGLLSRLVGPVSERDDLLQDVFVRFHAALPQFRGDASVRTFVARIAVNRAHDHLRQRRRRREDYYERLEELVPDVVDGRDAAIIASDSLAVLRCLERIGTNKRVAFVLRVVCEMTYGEIAELLDVKPDAARQRVAHARRELEKLLAREGICADD